MPTSCRDAGWDDPRMDLSRVLRRPRPTYANIMSTIAVFVALGGSATAASVAMVTGANVKNESLTGVDIKNRTIQGIDIKPGTIGTRELKPLNLTGAAIADGSLRGEDVTDGSLSAADLAPGTLTTTDLSGVITGVAPGDGLTGGGTAGDVSLGVDFGSVQRKITTSCPARHAISGFGPNGAPICTSTPVGSTDAMEVVVRDSTVQADNEVVLNEIDFVLYRGVTNNHLKIQVRPEATAVQVVCTRNVAPNPVVESTRVLPGGVAHVIAAAWNSAECTFQPVSPSERIYELLLTRDTLTPDSWRVVSTRYN